MHARGLPDAVCMATLDALIAVRLAFRPIEIWNARVVAGYPAL